MKVAPERLTQGGTTAIPSRSTSCLYGPSLSVRWMSQFITAAMNSTGWFAFSQAVW